MNMNNKPRALVAALLTLVMLLSLPFAGLAQKQDTQAFDAFAQTVADQVKRHWPHMHTAWPGADYTRHQLLLFLVDDMQTTQRAWVVNTNGMTALEPAEYKDMAAPQPGGYVKMDYQGMPSIAIGVDPEGLNRADEAQQAYLTATHELVHFYYQQGLAVGEESSRAQVYPIDPTPRLYRQMVYQRLISALEQPDKADEWLAKAGYWRQKWLKEYAEESRAIHSTDMAEGSARYMEYVGGFIGDAAAGEDRDRLAAQAIQRDEVFISADSESYELGYVAALLLDKHQPDWKDDFYARNKTPDQLLLEPVTPVEDTADSQVEQAVLGEVNAVNQEITAEVKDIERARQDASVPYLKLDVTDVMTSYESTGNYLVSGDDVNTSVSAQYRVGKELVSLRRISTLVEYTEEGRMYFIIPLTMAHKAEGDVLQVSADNLEVQGIRVATTQRDGRTVYQATAQDL